MNNTERFITRFYQSLGKVQPYQLSIENISIRLNLNVYYWEHSSAMTQLDGNYKLFINEQLNEQQQWQDFGHEMSHFFRDRGNRFVLRESFVDYSETKADYFAYHFCVPTFMLANIKGVDAYDVMDLFNVEFIEEFKTEGKENEAYVLAKVEFEDGSTKFEVSHEIDGISGHTENEYFDSEDAARKYIEDNNF